MLSTVLNRNNFSRESSFDKYRKDNETNDLRIITSLEIQVTNRCNLACTYCFQRNKSANTLLLHDYNRILDIIFNDEEDKDNFETFKICEGKRGYFFLYFIGGEPLLEIRNIRYFIYRFEEKLSEHNMENIKWKIGFTSNGTLYFEKSVQDFFKEYKDKIWMVTSIDGYSSESNDICRKFKNGKGTFNTIKKTLDDFNLKHDDDHKVKMKYVISKANLQYLFSDVKKMIEAGYSYVHCGLVEEDNWTIEDARLYFYQLYEISEYIIDNNLIDKFDLNIISKHMPTNRFNNFESFKNEKPCSIFYKEKMTIGADGTFIPCMALDSSSIGNSTPMIYGDIRNGELKTEEQRKVYKFLYEDFNIKDFYSYKCANCPCALRCGGCPGIMYSRLNRLSICESACTMHKAEYLAHTMYYNKICVIDNKYKSNNPLDGKPLLNKNDSLSIIDRDMYYNMIAFYYSNIMGG